MEARPCPGAPGIELSIAAPRAQIHALAPLLRKAGIGARYLGWLSRPQLWRAFAEHDALVMPSTTLEAMGLVALEAQACGLPCKGTAGAGAGPACRGGRTAPRGAGRKGRNRLAGDARQVGESLRAPC